MFNALTLAGNAQGSLAVTVLGALALFPPAAGLPGGTGTGIVPGGLYWISDSSSLRCFYWGRVAGVVPVRHLDMAFVCGVTILRWCPCLGIGQFLGTESPCGRLWGCCASPAPSAAPLLELLLCSLGRRYTYGSACGGPRLTGASFLLPTSL